MLSKRMCIFHITAMTNSLWRFNYRLWTWGGKYRRGRRRLCTWVRSDRHWRCGPNPHDVLDKQKKSNSGLLLNLHAWENKILTFSTVQWIVGKSPHYVIVFYCISFCWCIIWSWKNFMLGTLLECSLTQM